MLPVLWKKRVGGSGGGGAEAGAGVRAKRSYGCGWHVAHELCEPSMVGSMVKETFGARRACENYVGRLCKLGAGAQCKWHARARWGPIIF